MKKKFLPVLAVLSAIALISLLIKPAYRNLTGYLSKSEYVKANILIVEGWLPGDALEIAKKESGKGIYDHVFTIGMKSSVPYFKVYSNGYLIFYPGTRLSVSKDPGPHLIEVDAYSQMGGENRAHFNLYINDSLAADFLTVRHKRLYGVSWNGSLSNIDSITVQFDNDSWGKFGDRNLFVREIIIDHDIVIPYLHNSVYDILKTKGIQRLVNNITSNAESARNHLIALGMDPSEITAIAAQRVRINRTLTSALAFRDWLDSAHTDIKGINIVSMGPHSRRTWMTYNKVLKRKFEIGIISIPENGKNNPALGNVLRTLRETLGIVYYWIILLPY